VLSFLLERNVDRLRFVCLTHPHADHFSGLPPLLEHFGENVDEIWCFRLESRHWRKFLSVQENAETDHIRLWDAGHRAPSISGVEIDCLAPRPKELSRYISSLANSALRPTQYRADENQLSVVLRFRYGQSTALLGSDATTESWTDVTNQCERNGDNIQSNLVKVSHHGSTEGFFKGAWNRIALPNVTFGAISANGKYDLPHRAVITALRELGVRLHCTNYGPACLKTDLVDFSKFEGLVPSAKLQLLMLDQSSNSMEKTCDGDLHYHLKSDGSVDFIHQYSGLCPFHLPFQAR